MTPDDPGARGYPPVPSSHPSNTLLPVTPTQTPDAPRATPSPCHCRSRPPPPRGPVLTRLPCTLRAQTPRLHCPLSAAQRRPPLPHQGLARGGPTCREGPGHVQVRRLTQGHASWGHPRASGQGSPSQGFSHQSHCFTLSSPPTSPTSCRGKEASPPPPVWSWSRLCPRRSRLLS